MIDRFDGEYRWLSNFHPVSVMFEQREYRSVEHAYQAAKTLDISQRARIQQAATPGLAKKIGRAVTIRSDWPESKLDVMLELLNQKFNSERPELRALLRATGDRELIEGNYWGDTYWGVCRGKGENHLGRLLMLIRSEL